MKEGDLVWRTDILGYKGILLQKQEEIGKSWTIDPQLTFDYVSSNWKVFWFKHPFHDRPIIDMISEKCLWRIDEWPEKT